MVSSSSVDSRPISQITSFPVFLTTLALLVVALAYWKLSPAPLDPAEPPLAKSRIPLIGHLIGIIRYEAEYFQRISYRTQWPIFTMRILSKRIYVVTSPELVQAIYRNTKAFSFDPIFLTATERIYNIPPHIMKVIRHVPEGIDDEYHLVHKLEKVMTGAFRAGPDLQLMKLRSLDRFAGFLDDIDVSEQPRRLYSWIGDCFTVATAAAIYGPQNPISEDPDRIQTLWEFESSLGILFLNFLPSIIARKGYRARLVFEKAFRSYYKKGHINDASALAKVRQVALLEQGMSRDDIATYDGSLLGAGTINSIPAVFWLLCNILSNPALHAEIRQEVLGVITRRTKEGNEEAYLNMTLLHSSCPLLISTFHETLRLANAEVGNRIVMENVLLEGKYLLKKDSVIQMPAIRRHTSTGIWGDDAETFNPRRFMERKSQPKNQQKRQWQGGFTPFGGGKNLCPGRYFATTEILGVVATIVAGFEVKMTGVEEFKMPKMKKQGMSVQVKHPAEDVDVLIRRKDEFKGVKWTYEVGTETGAEYLAF